MTIFLLAVVGAVAVVRWLAWLLFPELALRLRIQLAGRALERALRAHARRIERR